MSTSPSDLNAGFEQFNNAKLLIGEKNYGHSRCSYGCHYRTVSRFSSVDEPGSAPQAKRLAFLFNFRFGMSSNFNWKYYYDDDDDDVLA